MRGYEIDKTTGFLTPTDPSLVGGFTARQKVMFLDSFKTSANLAKAAGLVGFKRKEVIAHFEQDAVFYKAYQEAVESLCDEAESHIYRIAGRNPTAAIMFLKAFRKERWGDKPQKEDNKRTVEKLKSLLDDK